MTLNERYREKGFIYHMQCLLLGLCSYAIYLVALHSPKAWLISILTFNIEPNDISTEYYKLPNIQLIGVQKGGSSAVSRWLYNEGVCHPAVFKNDPTYFTKEVHFFDHSDRYTQGIEFYANRFFNCSGHNFTMDATPDYFRYPEKVHATYYEAGGDQLSQLKLILILRDPAARELSLYNHMVNAYMKDEDNDSWVSEVAAKDGPGVMGFDEYVESFLGHNDSFYAGYLEEWTEYFARDQILVLSYDELLATAELTQDRIRKFLGADLAGRIPISNRKKGPLKVNAMSCATLAKFDNVFEAENDKLYRLLNQSSGPLMEQNPFPKFQKATCIS